MAAVQQLTTKENLDKIEPIAMEEQTVPSAGFSPQPNPFESINYTPKFNLQVPNNYVNHHHQQQQQHQQQYQNQQQHQNQNQNQNQNQHHIPNQQQQQQIVDGIIGLDSYGNLGDTFDFEMSLLDNPSDGSGGGSLLNDCAGYDLATVPSPSSWSLSSGSGYEGTSWNHTMSLYAASPTGGNNGSGSSPHLDMCAFSPDSKPIIQALSPNSNYDSSNLNYSSDSSYQSYPGSPIPGPNNNNNSNNGVQIKIENGHDELLGVPPGGGGSAGVGIGSGNGNGNGGCHDRESQCQSQQQTQENLNQQNLLLRQCLADTTFQKKYNFKPLEFPAASLSSLLLMDDPSIVSNATHELDGRGSNNGSRSNNTSSGGNSAEFGLGLGFGLNGIEPVFSMAFEHIRSDIHNACSTLAISPDPMEWSASDVQSWLTHVLSGPISPMNPILMMTSGDQQQQHQQQQCTATALRQFWNCDGRTMCSFSEEEFRLRDPVSGDGIFYNLELWKMLQFQNQNQNLNNKGQHGQHQSQDGNSTNTNNSNVNVPPPAIVVSRPTTMTSSTSNTNSLRGSVISAAGVPGSVSVPEVRTSSGGSNFDFDELFLTPTTISSMLNSNSNNSSDLHHRSPTPQLSSSSNSQGGSGGGVVIVKEENHSVSIERLSTSPFETSHNSSLEASPSSLVPTSAGSGTELMHTDDDDEEDDEDCDDEDFDSSEAPSVSKTSASTSAGDKAKGKKSKGAASNTGTGTGTGSAPSATPKSGAHIHLWQFLKELLSAPQQHGSCIRWLDQSRGVFKIEDSVRVARLWGLRKNRPAMNYDKLSRSIRQYYRKGIMRKTERSQRLVYQFCHPYGL